MNKESLNALAFERLKKDKLAIFSLLFIAVCIFLAVFAVVLSPDSTPMANEMHI